MNLHKVTKMLVLIHSKGLQAFFKLTFKVLLIVVREPAVDILHPPVGQVVLPSSPKHKSGFDRKSGDWYPVQVRPISVKFIVSDVAGY